MERPEDFTKTSDFVTEGLRALLEHAEIDWEHKARTPERIRAMWRNIGEHPSFEFTTFENDGYSQLIYLKDINFSSWCSHHVLPFFGRAAVGYIPERKQVGVSKLARVVQYHANTLQTQERFTQQVGEYLVNALEPKGVAVVMKATHTCVIARGAKSDDAVMGTSFMWGVMLDNAPARAEFLSLLSL